MAGWLYLRSRLDSCATLTDWTVRGPGLYDVKVVETACWGSDTVRVVLNPHTTRQQVTVLNYDLDETSRNLSLRDAMPEVTWLGRDHLKIVLRAAGSIGKKIAVADGVRIKYDIGVVELR